MENEPLQQELSKKQEYDLRKQEKDRKTRREEGKQAFTKWILYGLAAVIVIGGGGYYAWKAISKTVPEGEDLAAGYPEMGRDHIPEGSPKPEYNSNPPSSGSHYAIPAILGLYDKELPDERVIHNLEHGEIWIAYHPRVGEQVVEEIKKAMTSRVIATPRSANDTDIALVSWGYVDKFNLDGKELDIARIQSFIKRHQNNAPEQLSSDSMAGDLPDKPVYKP